MHLHLSKCFFNFFQLKGIIVKDMSVWVAVLNEHDELSPINFAYTSLYYLYIDVTSSTRISLPLFILYTITVLDDHIIKSV